MMKMFVFISDLSKLVLCYNASDIFDLNDESVLLAPPPFLRL